MIIDSGKESIIKNGDSKKILGADKQEGEKIIKSLIQDLFILKRGTQQLNTVTIQTAESIIALNNLMTLAPDALLPYTLISLIPHKEAFKWLVEKLKKIAQEEDLATRKAQNLLQDVASNVEQISLRHGEEFMEYEFNAQWQKLKILYSNYTHTNILRNALDDLMQIHNKVVDVLYLGDKVLQNKLTMDEVTIVHGSVNKVYSFFLSNLNVQINNIELVQAKTRIDKFYHLLNTTSKHAVRTINEENKVIFRNYTLKLNQKEIVHIDYLSLDKGNRYAITGDSGCGKSSMMIDLKEGVIGALNSEGEISLPKNADIIFLNQHLYLPKGSTLLEAVYFPKVLSKLTNKEVIELKKQITILFDEFGMDPGFVAMLDSQEYKLSGGELQKIGLMSAAINQLEEKSKQDEEKVIILILDESLTGLDQGALIATQKAITKYFKDAIVLVIDHHAHDNNYDQFYDKEMHYSTYSYKLLQNHDSVLKETEIGLFLNQAHKLFAKLENLKGLEIKIATKKNKVGISAELYFKIKAALNDTHFDQFKLEVEEKQQIISFTSSQNYTTKNAWIISKEIALRPLDDEYMSHHSSCFGPMDELYTRMNEGNALKIVTESDNILCQTICGKCSHHLYDD